MHWLSKRRIMVLMILPTLALYLLFIIIPVFVTIFFIALQNSPGSVRRNFLVLQTIRTYFRTNSFLSL